MTFKEKQYSKKMVRRLTILAAITFSWFVLDIAGVLILLTTKNRVFEGFENLSIILTILPVALCMTSCMWGSYHGGKLDAYKHAIETYREYRVFSHIIDLILQKDCETAINVHNNMSSIYKDTKLKDFSYIMIITSMLYLDDAKKQAGKGYLNIIKESYNPNKIKL